MLIFFFYFSKIVIHISFKYENLKKNLDIKMVFEDKRKSHLEKERRESTTQRIQCNWFIIHIVHI